MPFWQTNYRPAPQARAGAYRRQYGTTRRGKQFLDALERADNTGRLGRGKTYANKGLVLNIESERPGRLTAEIQGSMPWPYRIQMQWTPWPEGATRGVVEDIENNPTMLAQLLTGQLPESMLETLRERGLTIFPRNSRELELDGNCPDYATPCCITTTAPKPSNSSRIKHPKHYSPFYSMYLYARAYPPPASPPIPPLSNYFYYLAPINTP